MIELMTNFCLTQDYYRQALMNNEDPELINLQKVNIQTESLRLAQLAMLKGELKIEGNKLYLSRDKFIPLPLNFSESDTKNISHPYYWSAFTIIGNWN